jgi:hypothetical protein
MTEDLRKLLQEARDCIGNLAFVARIAPGFNVENYLVVLRKLEAALAQPAAEPVEDTCAWRCYCTCGPRCEQKHPSNPSVGQIKALETKAKRGDWILHHAGLLNDWAREWNPGLGMTLIKYLECRVADAMASEHERGEV